MDRGKALNMKTAYAATLALCLLAGGALQAFAKTYAVTGKTIDEVFISLEANGPGDGWAETRNSWSYACNLEQSGDSLVCKKASAKHTAEVLMPSWSGYNTASKCMKESWNAMYASLKKHEDRHVALAKGVDAKIKSALLATPPLPLNASQADIDAAFKNAADPVIADNNAVQEKFDADTGHGKNDPSDPVVLKACP
jgi:predicted secreted Zn-dependent protease